MADKAYPPPAQAPDSAIQHKVSHLWNMLSLTSLSAMFMLIPETLLNLPLPPPPSRASPHYSYLLKTYNLEVGSLMI